MSDSPPINVGSHRGFGDRLLRGDLQPPVTRGERGAIWSIVAAYLGILLVWAVLTPIYGTPDEPAHLNSAVRLTTGFDWPPPGDALISSAITAAREQADIPGSERDTFAALAEAYPGYFGVDQMSQHPPLYYLAAAGLLNAIDYADLRADFALLGVRIAGILFALPLPLLVWASVRRITRSPRAAVVGAAALLAVPQLAQVFASVSNDGLVVLLASTVVWLCIRVMTGDGRWPVVIATGLALGIALLTKGTALPLILFVALALAFAPRAAPVGARLLRAGVALAVAFATGGWWWLRNLLIYQDLQPSGLRWSRPTVEWEAGTNPDVVIFLDRMWARVTSSFWGNFGWLEYSLPRIVTDILTVTALGVVLAFAFRRGAQRWQATLLAVYPVILIVMLFANTWRHYLRTQMFTGFQGRYFFVTIVALIVLSAIAWRAMVARESQRTVGIGLVVAFAVVAALGLFREYIGVYEGSHYWVSIEGIATWIQMAPGGAKAILAASVIAVVAGVTALILVVRYLRGRDSLVAADRRADIARSV